MKSCIFSPYQLSIEKYVNIIENIETVFRK